MVPPSIEGCSYIYSPHPGSGDAIYSPTHPSALCRVPLTLSHPLHVSHTSPCTSMWASASTPMRRAARTPRTRPFCTLSHTQSALCLVPLTLSHPLLFFPLHMSVSECLHPHEGRGSFTQDQAMQPSPLSPPLSACPLSPPYPLAHTLPCIGTWAIGSTQPRGAAPPPRTKWTRWRPTASLSWPSISASACCQFSCCCATRPRPRQPRRSEQLQSWTAAAVQEHSCCRGTRRRLRRQRTLLSHCAVAGGNIDLCAARGGPALLCSDQM